MLIVIPKESVRGENRVAATPETTKKLIALGFDVAVEAAAGERSHFTDSAYEKAGARLVASSVELWASGDIVLKVQPPSVSEVSLLKEHAHLISLIWPARNPDLLKNLAGRHATVFALDSVPRISRAQKMDVLSSMANIAGYRAVIEAAGQYGRFFTGQITAAGKVPPAKVLVIGAGVAGLAAIGTARALGAVVRAFDTRPEVKEQVQSMGADFLMLDFKEEGAGEGGYAKVMSEAFIKAEMALFAAQAQEVDIIVTTALIPGRKAPVLITEDMLRSMKRGSVIVDLAAETGGNCAVTVADQIVERHGVTVIGYTDLPSRLPTQSSTLYGNNLVNFLADLCKTGSFAVDNSDDIVRGTLVVHDGTITWPPPKRDLPQNLPAAAAPRLAPSASTARPAKAKHGAHTATSAKSAVVGLIGLGLCLALLGQVAPAAFLSHATVFVLACFIGWQLVWNVNPALHTPLMSVTNAISGIIVIGAILQVGGGALTTVLALIAILVATINVVGGFWVTQRMLGMFRK